MSRIKVVTIGRHYCAGGSSIGRLTADILGVKCYDREIVEMASEKSGIPMEDINLYEEAALNAFKSPINIFGKEKSMALTERIFAAETEIIYEITSKEDCVIVGRCADFVLKNKVKTLDAFIYASQEKRMDVALKRLELDYEETEQRLKKYDKKRAYFYNTNTNKKWGEMSSYDICLDSGKMGYRACAEILAGIVKASK